MNDDLISVVVPAYNIERYIERSLESLLRQTYPFLEVVVVDDGSTDGTAALIDRIAEKEPRLIAVHKPNGGVSSARIEGIRRASGQWIGFADGDDFVEPEMFEHLLQNAIRYHADISHCGYQMVFPDGHVDLYYGTGRLVEQTNEEGLKDLIEGAFVEPGLVNKLFRRRIVEHFEQSPLWDPEIKINEDLLMNYLLFSRAEKSVYEDIPYYHYLVRKHSASTSKTKHHVADPLRVMDTIRNDLKGKDVLYPVAYTRYLRVLISVANQKQWAEESRKAQRQLRQEIQSGNLTVCTSQKLRLMALAAAYWLSGYRQVRKIHDNITGISQKYDV